ncbi:hypothetical protein OC842_006519 [Tilletia horrida]|uniref:RING-type domain-containing protein n=1 Tax=Tilletia horrida TaxID=155126 RepID=A0AAN6G5C6_9BASI|nr:hypothetical protein OC842_006519 [Tilletia horrida]
MPCSICLDGYGPDDAPAHRPVALVPCGHIFHHGCVIELLGSTSARLASQQDLAYYRTAVEQRRSHPLHVQRVSRQTSASAPKRSRNGRQAAAPAPAYRSERADQAEALVASSSRLNAASTVADDEEEDDSSDSSDDDDEEDKDVGNERRGHDAHRIGLPVPNMPLNSPIVQCPLCKTICPTQSILDLWPSEHDDLDWYKHFLARDGTGPSGTHARLHANGIDPHALFSDLAQFRQCLSSYVMHLHGVDVRINTNARDQTLQMVERQVPDDYIAKKLKTAIETLDNAATRFASAEAETTERLDRIRKREAELSKLQSILNEKDARLTRAATQLARDQGEVNKLAARAKQERIQTATEASLIRERARDLEARERDARQRERDAKLELSHGLAKRDAECAERIAEAEMRAEAAERAREEAEEHARRAGERREELSEKWRKLCKKDDRRKREIEELTAKLDTYRRKLNRFKAGGSKKEESHLTVLPQPSSSGSLNDLVVGPPSPEEPEPEHSAHPPSSSPVAPKNERTTKRVLPPPPPTSSSSSLSISMNRPASRAVLQSRPVQRRDSSSSSRISSAVAAAVLHTSARARPSLSASASGSVPPKAGLKRKLLHIEPPEADSSLSVDSENLSFGFDSVCMPGGNMLERYAPRRRT